MNHNMKNEVIHNSKVDGKTVGIYTIGNGTVSARISNFGARVIGIDAPDRNGVLDDIVAGYNELERYIDNKGERFLGATVGRVANRICKGRMTVDGVEYSLPVNNGVNSLHGGIKGIDMVVWDVVCHSDNVLTLHYIAPDGQDGYPGNLDITMTFTVTDDNALDLKYEAVTDKATPVNLSQHAFFNLKGSRGGTILDHSITICADSITPVDETLIPTGELMSVEGTPFDFRTPHLIGERIEDNHQQLIFGGGYDHNWVISGQAGSLRKACVLTEETSGRCVEVYTDQPGMQFYTGNFFDGSYDGKVKGIRLGRRDALALETQNFPDAVNHPNFPSCILRPGEKYTQHTFYRFSVQK